jgi:hypothetical protein
VPNIAVVSSTPAALTPRAIRLFAVKVSQFLLKYMDRTSVVSKNVDMSHIRWNYNRTFPLLDFGTQLVQCVEEGCQAQYVWELVSCKRNDVISPRQCACVHAISEGYVTLTLLFIRRLIKLCVVLIIEQLIRYIYICIHQMLEEK